MASLWKRHTWAARSVAFRHSASAPAEKLVARREVAGRALASGVQLSDTSGHPRRRRVVNQAAFKSLFHSRFVARGLRSGPSLSPAEHDPDEKQARGAQGSQRVLKSERDAFRSIFEHHPQPMLVCDVGSLRILAANAQAARLHGSSPQELEQSSLFELRRVSDLTRLMLKRAVGSEVALGFGYHTRRDGSVFPVHLTVHHTELGGSPAWLCLLQSLEERLNPRESEQQRRLLESVGRVAGGVAHDINNLLSVVLSFASLLSTQLPAAASAQVDLNEIRAAAERASLLTKQLLNLSRTTPAAPKPLVLNEVVARLEKVLRRLLEEHMTLELSLEEGLDQVLADATQLERLLVQLVGEARTQGTPGTRLLIETRNAELDGPEGPTRQVVLRVSDSGSSLSAEVAALSSLVESGTAWLESEPGSGARFVATFPSLKTASASSPPPAPQKKRERCVLVVQDNPHLRKTLRTYFARSGYQVLDADSSLEALRALEQGAHVDLLLTDYALTDGSGPELARAARELFPDLRVLIATGHPEQRAALREDPHTAAISKPFDLREFAALIERLLEGDALNQA